MIVPNTGDKRRSGRQHFLTLLPPVPSWAAANRSRIRAELTPGLFFAWLF